MTKMDVVNVQYLHVEQKHFLNFLNESCEIVTCPKQSGHNPFLVYFDSKNFSLLIYNC